MPRILLVDDDALFLMLIGDFLIMERYTVESAGTISAALNCLGNFNPQLLICSAMLPNLGSYQLIETVRALLPCSALPILALTTVSRREQQYRLSTQVEACLVKPFKPGELLAAIRRLLPGEP